MFHVIFFVSIIKTRLCLILNANGLAVVFIIM